MTEAPADLLDTPALFESLIEMLETLTERPS
jgi:hypothetical protein